MLLINLQKDYGELFHDKTFRKLIETIDLFFINKNISTEFIKFQGDLSYNTFVLLKNLSIPFKYLKIGTIYNIIQLKSISSNIKKKVLNECVKENEKRIINEINKLYNFEFQLPWRNNEHIDNQFIEAVLNKIRINAVQNLERNEYNLNKKYNQLIENHRKLFVASADSIEIFILKLVDRLAIIKTLCETTYPEIEIDRLFEKNIAKETLIIHAKLADHLRIRHLKWQLEDSAFKLLNPKKYKEISDYIQEKRNQREQCIFKIIQILNDRFRKNNINVKIQGRPKNIYSIYQKIKKRAFHLNQINDLLAIRIIVSGEDEEKNIKNCYLILKELRKLWKPVVGIYDNNRSYLNWIKNPKINNYRSIHTTLLYEGNGIFKDDKLIEIQIRTQKMHEEAEYGAAAHWTYKYDGKSDVKSIKKNNKFWANISKFFSERISGTQICNIKYEIGSFFNKSCLVISPKGEIFELKKEIYKITQQALNRLKSEISANEIVDKLKDLKNHEYMTRDAFIKALNEKLGRNETEKYKSIISKLCFKINATVLDYAYNIHSELGEKLELFENNIVAKVNNKHVPIDYILQNGDVVELSEY